MEKEDLNKKEALKRLNSDSDYYGEYGKQFLSFSDIGSLLKNPAKFKQSAEQSINMLIGGYFHTLVCEPDKVEKYKIIDASTRGTKKYKEFSGGELCLLQTEVDKIEALRKRLLANDIVRGLIQGDNIEYEKPQIEEIHGEWWKGKADIINHDEKLIIDLKTTNDLNGFRYSAKKWNYDSQAYIYQRLFGYEFIFIAIDKNTHNIGVYDCSPQFLENGEQKVVDAIENYRLFHKNKEFDFNQYLKTETL